MKKQENCKTIKEWLTKPASVSDEDWRIPISIDCYNGYLRVKKILEMGSNSEYEQRNLWSNDWLNKCAEKFIEDKLRLDKQLKSDTFQLLIKEEWVTGRDTFLPPTKTVSVTGNSDRSIEYLTDRDGNTTWRYKKPNK